MSKTKLFQLFIVIYLSNFDRNRVNQKKKKIIFNATLNRNVVYYRTVFIYY